MVSPCMKDRSSLTCRTNWDGWIKRKYFHYETVIRYHHWKLLLVGVGLLGLCWLGYKSVEVEREMMGLWIWNSSELYNETSYISQTSGAKLDAGSVETVLQVSMDNLLSTEYFLEHLQLLQIIINLTIRYESRTFTFSHFCQKIHLPKMHYLDESYRAPIENMMPCKIITPLNCFWEGSKLLGPYSRFSIPKYDIDAHQSIKIDWKSFNISQNFFNSFKDTWQYKFFVKLFEDAGIGSGYVSKPCLDVTDPFCPNKHQKVNHEAIISQGCYQIAKNLERYSKSLFIGKDNKGMQSLLLLRSSSDILETLSVSELDWTESKIQFIVNLWLSELRKTVIKYNSQRPYLQSVTYRNTKFQSQRVRKSSFYVFTNNSLNSALNHVSNDKTILAKYLISNSMVMLFVVIIFLSSDNLVRSHSWLAITGTLLLSAAIVSGLGLTAAAGFTFSALTTQVVPFLTIGLGLDDIIILTKKYMKFMDNIPLKKNSPHPIAQTLHDCAIMLLVSFLTKIVVLSSAALIPIPLMRSFCIQILFITVLQTSVNVFLYPCLLYFDSIRRQSNRIDILCCLLKRQSSQEDIENQQQSTSSPLQYDYARKETNLLRSRVVFSTEFTTSPNTLIPNNVHQYCEINPVDDARSANSSRSGSHVTSKSASKNTSFDEKALKSKRHRCCWKFRYRLSKTFLHIIVLVPVQITVICVTILIIVMGIYSAIYIDCGLIFNSIFIRDSNEYNYVKYESKTFRMQTFSILTKELDYIQSQESLLQLHNEVKDLSHAELLENGKFWLSSFISWLDKIQKDFDKDVKNKYIFHNGSWSKNASDNGLLALTLMVQDGDMINYKKLKTSRLIKAERVDGTNFYLFLNVWRSVSVEFDSLPCVLFPKMIPFNMDDYLPNSKRRQPSLIRMAGVNLYQNNPLQFVSCKYFYKGQSQRDEVAFVKNIRSITNKFTERGVPAIPIGNVFSLTEHYLKLRFQLLVVAIILSLGMFVISAFTINHFFASLLATFLLSSSLFTPMLFMNFYHIPLNATSGVMVLWSGGLGFRFSLFLIVSYVEQSDMQSGSTCLSTIELRSNQCEKCSSNTKLVVENTKQMQLKRALEEVQYGKAAFSTVLGMAFILMTDVNFLWQNFLLLPSIGLIHSLFNYYYVTPILCFYFISKSERKPTESPMHKSNPSRSKSGLSHKPSTSSTRYYRSSPSRERESYKLDDNNEGSIHGKLSIIPEESSSVLSSIKSSISNEHQNIFNDSSSDSSKSQETNSHFMKQNVESSLVIHYTLGNTKSPKKDWNTPPELAVKTFFKYRQPLGQDP